MPGRTPQEAQFTFLEPIKAAVSCLGAAKVTASGPAVGKDLAWSLNGGEGMFFADGMHFEASMHYRIIRADAGWRVTTLAYRYRMGRVGIDLFRMHWHPTGNSPFKLPHFHLNLEGKDFTDGSEEQHFPSGRMTFEDAVHWAILAGITPVRDDWQEVLDAGREAHIRHRSWAHNPIEAASVGEP